MMSEKRIGGYYYCYCLDAYDIIPVRKGVDDMKSYDNFRRGFARAVDLSGSTAKRVSRIDGNGFEKDREALQGDWANVGESLRNGIEKYRECGGYR